MQTELTTTADDQLPEVKESFHITSPETASWLVRRICEARNHKRKVADWAAAEIRRAEREEAFFVTRWGRELEEWARQQIAKQHKRKSLNLPSGTIGFRAEPQRLNCLDEDRLLDWCRRNLPGAVKTTESVLKSVLTEHVKATGEVPDGAELGGGGERFFIR